MRTFLSRCACAALLSASGLAEKSGDVSSFFRAPDGPITTIASAPGMPFLLAGTQTNVHAVSSEGTLLWSAPTLGHVQSIDVTARLQIIISCRQAGLISVGLEGRELWRMALPDLDSKGVALDHGGNIYLLVGETLTAVGPTGIALWKLQLAGALGVPVMGLGNRIIVQTKRGVTCVSRDGIVAWESALPELYEDDLTADEAIVLVPRWKRLYALTKDGLVAWSYSCEPETWAAPVKLTQKSGLRAVSTNKLSSFSREGELLWQETVPRASTERAGLWVDPDGTSYCIPSYGYSVILVVSKDGYILAKVDAGYVAHPRLIRFAGRLLFCGISRITKETGTFEVRSYQLPKIE